MTIFYTENLQSSSILLLLPFLLEAMVPRAVLIWRSDQNSQAAFRSARTEGADRGGSEGRPPFSLLILQPPFTNSSKYFVMLQGVTRSERQAVIQLVWRLCKQKSDLFCSKLLFLPEPTDWNTKNDISARHCRHTYWIFEIRPISN